MNFLGRIATPTYCLSAEDDAFLPASVLAVARQRASPSIDFRTTAHGGHIGFIGGRVPWRPVYWAEEQAVGWLADRVG